MSPGAVTARLRRVSELRRLCLALSQAGKVDGEGIPGASPPSLEYAPGTDGPGGSVRGEPAA
ncbi:hypothetical protein NNJEOMEG_00496 [Fundidesulfovibrio magnetotacticus]|uniref:Uncharacterized protein n=1 Tax=Fundidesulfovibrio magnetotacticus TaxID=2730080 RepID=A0A6V8LNV6_9BACT|nr:hypothetical protein [Fundidesulfovibrio magnetotacticus]GFK92670.1 hypothetical protein NNJEOMEG_00496 [Fundidesulfovibrio magnetotacticus]